MSTASPSFLRRWAGRLWWLLDGTRRLVLNLLFVALIAAVVFAVVKSRPGALADKTALVLELKGSVAEQQASDARGTALGQLRGETASTIPLRDVLTVLDAAAKDPKIERVVLVLDEFEGAGLATLREIAAGIDRVKAGGKQVVAWGSGYDQRQYFLAAHAGEVWMHPLGTVFIEGFGRYRNYYRDALDKAGVTINLLRVGTYKSFGEPFVANAQSPEARQADAFLYEGLWSAYVEGVERSRKFSPGTLMRAIDEAPQRLAAAGGDVGKLALDSKLVDALKTRDEVRQLLIERGAKDSDGKSFRQVSFADYLARQAPKARGDGVGVVMAEGEIVDGEAPAGTVGGKSTAELIRKAREDEAIKALVLRVNSPGGSVFGSELVRRELELTRAAGKPVVVSMGDVAASGGYWISLASDEVFAYAATITGSIGVFALLPTVDKTLDKLGVHTDGVTTTWLGGATDPRRPLNPKMAQIIQSAIDRIYADFTGRAAEARKTTPAKIDAVAQGRVWTGAQAKERGLVDTLGSYGDALASAARRAKLADGYRVDYIERERGGLDRVLDMVGGEAGAWLREQFDAHLRTAGVPPRVAQGIGQDMRFLADLAESRRPYQALVHCLCTAP